MEPTINSSSGRIVGSNNAQVVEQFNVMLRTSCEGLVLNHPPIVVAVAVDDGAVPKEDNSGSRRGKTDAGFPHRGEDAPPSILIFLSEDIVEDVLQRLPLKEGCAVGAEPVVNLHEGLREGGGSELVGQLEEHGVGSVVDAGDVDGGHDKPLSAPFSRESLLYLLPRLME